MIWAISILFATLLSLMIGVFSYVNYKKNNRPLFHSRFAAHKESIFPYWLENLHASDSFGNYAFFDDEINMLVVAEPRREGGAGPYPVSTSQSVTFFPGTNAEVTFPEMGDTLLLVRRDKESKTISMPNVVVDFKKLGHLEYDRDLRMGISEFFNQSTQITILSFFGIAEETQRNKDDPE